MKLSFALLSILAAMASNLALAADVPFTINNIESLEGTIVVALHPSNEDWPRPPKSAQRVNLAAKVGSVSGVFHNVADGEYAMSVIQDLNNNGKFDTNFIGLPKEPFGVSGNKLPEMSEPKYDDAKFAVKGNATAIVMNLKQP